MSNKRILLVFLLILIVGLTFLFSSCSYDQPTYVGQSIESSTQTPERLLKNTIHDYVWRATKGCANLKLPSFRNA